MSVDGCDLKNKLDSVEIGNRSVIFARGYEGIPEILLMNIISSIIVILIFSVIRKKAWQYGRLALVHRKRSTSSKHYLGYDVFKRILQGSILLAENKSSALARSTSTGSAGSNIVEPSKKSRSPPTSDKGKTYSSDEVSKEGISSKTKASLRKRVKDKFANDDRGFFRWILLMFQIEDSHIAKKCGQDSVNYAIFQRTLIVFMSIASVIGLCVILPIHLKVGTAQDGTTNHFAKTSINNIAREQTSYLWCHIIVLLIFTVICIILMRRFGARLPSHAEEQQFPTIMITNMDKTLPGNKALIYEYFRVSYRKFTVKDVNFAYDVQQLKACNVKLKNAQGALRDSLKSHDYQSMKVARFSKKMIKCSDYYQAEVNKYLKEMDKLKKASDQCPLPICFVTFQDVNHALQVVKDFRKTSCGPFVFIPPALTRTKLDEKLKPGKWVVVMAPDPDDILWHNLAAKHVAVRAVFMNIIAFITLFFMTTPSLLVKWLSALPEKADISIVDLSEYKLLSDGIPVVLILILASLLPYLVSYVEYLSCYTTQSEENLMVVRKVTIFLWFMVLILPSLSLPSAEAFADSFMSSGGNSTWKCIYMANNGAFYTNYVVSSSWICVAMEFARLGVLIKYGYHRITARSKFERYYAISSTVWPFPFGDNYAWLLLLFAIILLYGVIFPLILPAGLIYFTFKYYVDRYNLYYAYTPGKISREQHVAAMNFVLFSCVLSQFVFYVYLHIRTDMKLKDFKSLVMLIAFLFTLVGYIWHMVFGWIWYGITRVKPLAEASDEEKQIHINERPSRRAKAEKNSTT